MTASSASARMDGRLCPPDFRLAFAQPDHVGQAQHHRQFVQGVLLDQVGAHA
jgi:hypothetical protein